MLYFDYDGNQTDVSNKTDYPLIAIDVRYVPCFVTGQDSESDSLGEFETLEDALDYAIQQAKVEV